VVEIRIAVIFTWLDRSHNEDVKGESW
jgi:hypothetical protein